MKLLKCNLGKCSTIVINGRVYKGGNLSVIDGKVFIDGKEQPEENAKIFEIKIVGNVEHLEVGRGNVSIEGNVTGGIKCGGSVDVTGKVEGNVDCGGSAEIGGDVIGNVDAGGSSNISGNVSGDVDAGGSVYVGKRR